MNPRQALSVTCLGLASAFTFCCCATAQAPSLSEVKEFDGYRVYYAGKEVAGLPLEGIQGEEWKSDPRAIRWSFIYGRCTRPPEGEAGCPPPLQIHNYSTCRRWAGISGSKPQLYNFRGTKAVGSGTSIEDPLEIFTGNTTVVIFSEQPKVAIRAARRLLSVRQARPVRLSPPIPGSLRGKLPCQRQQG